MPYTATTRTSSASSLVTDSAAAATAIACGVKTHNGKLGVDTGGKKIESMAEVAKKNGYKVGIITSVNLNHATPGGFYAHRKSRGEGYNIGLDMVNSNFDFFAGGDPVYNGDRKELYKRYTKSDYTIARGIKQFDAMCDNADRMILFQSEVLTQLPYSIDQSNDDLNLAQITKAGIEFLTDKSDKGFFFMIEGGKIDYASHSNDAATMIKEVQDFDAAIKVALDFYNEHSDETLIVVTADHETGGFVLGYFGNYTLNLDAMKGQKCSEDVLAGTLQTLYKEGKINSCEALTEVLQSKLGITPDEGQMKHLNGLYRKVAEGNKEQSDKYLSRIADYAIGIVSQQSAISWASGNHSGTFVPLFAIGKGAEKFHGIIDNTDVPKTISNIAGYR
jgi:alkaline phosphatase